MGKIATLFWGGVLLLTLIWAITFGFSWRNLIEGGVVSFYFILALALIVSGVARKR